MKIKSPTWCNIVHFIPHLLVDLCKLSSQTVESVVSVAKEIHQNCDQTCSFLQMSCKLTVTLHRRESLEQNWMLLSANMQVHKFMEWLASDCKGGLNCLWSSIMILKHTNTFSSFSICMREKTIIHCAYNQNKEWWISLTITFFGYIMLYTMTYLPPVDETSKTIWTEREEKSSNNYWYG